MTLTRACTVLLLHLHLLAPGPDSHCMYVLLPPPALLVKQDDREDRLKVRLLELNLQDEERHSSHQTTLKLEPLGDIQWAPIDELLLDDEDDDEDEDEDVDVP